MVRVRLSVRVPLTFVFFLLLSLLMQMLQQQLLGQTSLSLMV